MSLFDDLAGNLDDLRRPPTRTRRSKALHRKCRHCPERTVGGATLCAACSHAARRASGTPDRSGLPVSCWCEDTTVWCEVRLLMAGLTRSCGLTHCTADLIAA